MKWRRGWTILSVLAIVALLVIGIDVALSPKSASFRGDEYALVCLAGDEALCPLPLSGPRDARGEPWIAVHPADPSIIVVAAIARSTSEDAQRALGEPEPQPTPSTMEELRYDLNRTTGMGPGGPPATEPLGEPCSGITLCLHATEDGGKTWFARRFPMIGTQPFTADPTMVFDSADTLHVVGIPGSGLFYAQTRDLGRTWTEPFALAPKNEGHDRPWLSIHGSTIVMTWQNTNAQGTGPSHLVFSNDLGRSWSKVDGFQPACSLQTPALHLGGTTWLVGCANRSGALFHHVSLETGAVEEVSSLRGSGNIPMLARAEDGRLTLIRYARAGLFGAGVQLLTSKDDARSWSDPVDIGAASLASGWDWHWVGWAELDPDGVAHVLLVGGTGAPCRNQRCDAPATSHSVAWLAVDPGSGDLVGQQLVGSGSHDRPADAQAYTTDDYHHIVPYQDGALLAWSHDATLTIAMAKPNRP